ncbi:MAG: sigma-70 family RNA polymerase sigma factor [Chthoniobacter sp.]|nr:sigma-70 family RNA polymerase sigma factor [Chthoniobacter sp.]
MSSLEDRQHDQFLRLFAEHEPALRTFVRSLVPSRGDASEVMQDVAVVLWQKYESARDFRKWAFGVARYEALAFLRDRVRDRHVFDEGLVHKLADDAAAAGPRHEAHREALEGCLQKLPERQRALVLAAYTAGTRMDELAALRGQTAMSLYKVLHRIRQMLLECVRRTVSKEELA